MDPGQKENWKIKFCHSAALGEAKSLKIFWDLQKLLKYAANISQKTSLIEVSSFESWHRKDY